MKIQSLHRPGGQEANALLMVMVLAGAMLITLAGVLSYARTNTDLTSRSAQYARTTAAAEAATENIIARIGNDYQNHGVTLVYANLASYRTTVPTPAEYSYWSNFEFRNEQNQLNTTTVDFLALLTNTALSMKYQGLRGFAYDLRVVSQARETTSPFALTCRNQQEVELALVPVFQYAIFYNNDLEFNRCAPMRVSGPVHCNSTIYRVPYSTLDFWGQVTAAGKIAITSKKPGDPQSAGTGTTTFHSGRKEKVQALHLPLGTNNRSAAARQLIELPPWSESASSLMGQMRYYNLADMVVSVSSAGAVTVTSGLWNNFATTIPAAQASLFVKTTKSFYDDRENKTCKLTEIDVDQLRRWNNTNTALRSLLATKDIRTIYVADNRANSSSTFYGVRLVNGSWLPPQALGGVGRAQVREGAVVVTL